MQTVLTITVGLTTSLAVAFICAGIFQPNLVADHWEWGVAALLIAICLLSERLRKAMTDAQGSQATASRVPITEQNIPQLVTRNYYLINAVQFLSAAEGQMPQPIGLMRLKDCISIVMSCPDLAAQVARGLQFQIYYRAPGRANDTPRLVGNTQVVHVQKRAVLQARLVDIVDEKPLRASSDALRSPGYISLAEGTWTSELVVPTLPELTSGRRG